MLSLPLCFLNTQILLFAVALVLLCFVVEQTAFCASVALWLVVETCEPEVHLPTAHIQQAEGSGEWNSSAHHSQKLVFLSPSGCLCCVCCAAVRFHHVFCVMS